MEQEERWEDREPEEAENTPQGEGSEETSTEENGEEAQNEGDLASSGPDPKNAINKYRQNMPTPSAAQEEGKAWQEEDEPEEKEREDEAGIGEEVGNEDGSYSHAADPSGKPVVEKVEFPPLSRHAGKVPPLDLSAFNDISLNISAELGRAQLKVRDLIALEKGSVLKLNRVADESIDLLLNEIPFAQGEVVVINERFGVRIVSFKGSQQEPEDESHE